ncbi:MAG TPA: knotted carbamoyltransferase YgeW, partial [Firmicutes bacterium]|nr:knotted carbamoyltransferase YgeW [Bacillota bacterium]
MDRFDSQKLEDLVYQFKKLKFNMFRRDFLLSWEKGHEDILAVVSLAEILKYLYRHNISLKIFQTGLGVSFFRDKSTRTRMAFASACDLLGLSVQEMDEEKSQISHGETIRETANMISFLSQVIGIRDDMYLGRGHNFMTQVAEALDEGFDKEILRHRPAVINLQCDLDHPTQTIADLVHVKNYFTGFEKLRGKKLVMSWAYSSSYGKPLSVPQGIIGLMTRFGMDVTLAHPEGYELVPEVMEKAKEFTEKSGGRLSISHNMKEAFNGADIVYPKSWAPYSVMQRRADLVKNDAPRNEFEQLEKECLAENAKHKDWFYDENIMNVTNNGNALYMHCLPADVKGLNCVEGEVSYDVFEKFRLETYKEARNKPYVIAAMIFLCCFQDPAAYIDKICTL